MREGRPTPDVVVVGAGVFGAWTAFHLQRAGVRTLLVDAWEPGHARASSAGESRIIRSGYGARRLYTHWAWEALAQWKHWQEVWGVELYHRLGALWLFAREDDYARASQATLRQEGIPVETIAPDELPKRFPQLSPEGIGLAYLEPEGGALLAERSVQAVVKAFLASGGRWHLGRVEPPVQAGADRLEEIPLADGTRLAAGSFVFACGPWLPQMFPATLGTFIRVTRQDVFWFGVPAGDTRFSAGTPESGSLPVWLTEEFYGIPALAGQGFKIADTGLGPPFDPTMGERIPADAAARQARAYLAQRFPAMKYAPLLRAHVCQYESTRDGHLLIDRNPAWENVWLVGGGSGHGFKLGPKVGQVVASLVTGETPFDSAPLDFARGGQGRPVPPEELRLRPRPAGETQKPAY